MSSLLSWAISKLAWARWWQEAVGQEGSVCLQRGGSACCGPTPTRQRFFPVMRNRFFCCCCSFSVVIARFLVLHICSIGRFVSALGVQTVPVLWSTLHYTSSNTLIVQRKCFPLTCEINLFIGRNQNKPLWSGNIIVPFRFYFDEAYNTIPVSHLFKS